MIKKFSMYKIIAHEPPSSSIFDVGDETIKYESTLETNLETLLGATDHALIRALSVMSYSLAMKTASEQNKKETSAGGSTPSGKLKWPTYGIGLVQSAMIVYQAYEKWKETKNSSIDTEKKRKVKTYLGTLGLGGVAATINAAALLGTTLMADTKEGYSDPPSISTLKIVSAKTAIILWDLCMLYDLWRKIEKCCKNKDRKDKHSQLSLAQGVLYLIAQTCLFQLVVIEGPADANSDNTGNTSMENNMSNTSMENNTSNASMEINLFLYGLFGTMALLPLLYIKYWDRIASCFCKKN